MKRQKKDVWNRKEKRGERLNGVYIRTKRKFGREMNENVDGKSTLFWKEMSKCEERKG